MTRAKRVRPEPAVKRRVFGGSIQNLATPPQSAPSFEGVLDLRHERSPPFVPLGGRQKRIFDLVAASIITILVAPLLLFIAVAIALSGGGPFVYGHTRIGFRGKRFQCLKFRTMVVDSDDVLAKILASDPNAATEWALNQKLTHDPRITAIGKLLRRTSLDELPQLLNVMRGEMSLVGPRPVVPDELQRYGRRQSAYLSARPGMTGLWQISGRNKTTYDRRVRLDVAYARRWNFGFDILILLRTVPELLWSKGAS